MEPVFYGSGKWTEISTYKMLMSVIRRRPRDLVMLCTYAARKAFEDKSSVILTKHFKQVFQEYSMQIISDAQVEYQSELPDICRLLLGMRPSKVDKFGGHPFRFSKDELLKKINSVMQTGAFHLFSKPRANNHDLMTFLYKINFITARKVMDNGKIQRKFFDEVSYLSNTFVDFGYDWEIHPAYRWAIQPESLDDVFKDLDDPQED
jgi:hypothetical protein